MSSIFAVLVQINLLMKTDFTVICVPCIFEHVCYESFSSKNCKFRRYLMLKGNLLQNKFKLMSSE